MRSVFLDTEDCAVKQIQFVCEILSERYLVIERAEGVWVYADAEKRLDPLPAPRVQRAEVIDEVYAALLDGRAPLHGGEWGMATMEVCAALLESAKQGREIALRHQVAVPG